ncbi:MAG TPA: translocation/assembly module TamB domain-containing protein, partial [Allocoleopsis sp.]
PIEITGDQSLISFSGSVGGQEYNGKLKFNLPARMLSERFDLPIDITGKIDSEVTLGGNINNPQAIGELNLLDGTLNGESFESILLSFSYNDSRLNFSTKNSEQNLTISGNIPYKFNEKQVTPNNNFGVKIDVKNDGFSLLNLLTRRQVVWQSGEGKLNLSVTGSFNPENSAENSIIAQGNAEIKKATIKGQVFPEPVTDVNGNISFDFDKIQVQNFQGQFSGGEVTVTGGIPIFNPVNSDDHLGLNIDITKKLAFNLKGIYNGSVRGNIDITGTAIAPKIGGNLELFDGLVYLTEKTPQILANNNNNPKDSLNSTPTEFNNLKISLKNNVQVVQPPVLNFLAKGDLTINGNLDSIRPQGKIELERGSVNLFTTEFRLLGGYPNQAKFFPEQGLIPTLDVKLQTSVSEVVRNSLAINPNLTDINEKSATNLGALQTVRIQANVQGITNQLTTDNLELISSPPRSKSEIVSLLGGGFVQNLVEPGNRTLGV